MAPPDPFAGLAAEERGDTEDRVFVEAVRHLVGSTDPAVVFGSLAHLCVGRLADCCTVDLVEYGCESQHLQTATVDPGQADASSWLVNFASDPDVVDPYFGVAKFSWRDRIPTNSDRMVLSLLVDRAVAAVAFERMAEEVVKARSALANLGVALETRERIGIAVGLLMQVHDCGATAAFDRIRLVSHRDHRLLRDVAEDVIARGRIEDGYPSGPHPTPGGVA